MSSENPETMKRGDDSEGDGQGRSFCGRSRFWLVPMIAAAIAIKGALFMALWNALIPELFHGPELKYLQAIGLLILGKMLVGFKGGHGPGRFGGGFGHRMAMKKRFWAKMSEEERCELRDHLRKRWKE